MRKSSRIARIAVGLLGALALFAAAGTVHASAAAATLAVSSAEGSEATVSVPDDLQPDQVAEFVAPLDDGTARELLIAELKTQAEANVPGVQRDSGFADFLSLVRQNLSLAGERVDTLREAFDDLPDKLAFMYLLLTGEEESLEPLVAGIGKLLVMIVAGMLASLAMNRVCQSPRRAIAHATPRHGAAKLGYLLARLALDVINVGAFAFAGFALSFALHESVDPMRLFGVTYLSVAAAAYLAWVLARFTFAPALPDKRLVPMTDSAARRNTWVLAALAALLAAGFFSGGFLELIGADPDTLALLRLALLSVFAVTLVAHLATAPEPPTPDAPVFRQWRWLAIVHVIVVVTIWAVTVLLGRDQANVAAFLSIALVLAVPPLDRALARAFGTRPDAPGATDDIDGDEGALAPAAAFTATAVRAGVSAVLLLGALLAVVEAATGAIAPWLATADGQALLRGAGRVLATLVGGAIVWSLVRGTIERTAEREEAKALALAAAEGAEADGEGGSGVVGTRTATLIPLLRGTAFVAIVAVAGMSALSALGIDIGPLLAGAGVVGIAIGFGAQALVRDVVSGVFFLVDDAFRIGEYIEMGELRGEVERISIRSMQLRHHRGPVQTVPFGEIKSITNYNRDWVIYKQEFRVPYDTDVEKVRKLIKKLGARMLEHPEYGSFFIEQLKSQGVRRIEDSALIIGTKFMCKPRRQFVLRRHVFQEIQTLFQENGIEFATRRVIVEGGQGDAAAALAEDPQAPTDPAAPPAR